MHFDVPKMVALLPYLVIRAGATVKMTEIETLNKRLREHVRHLHGLGVPKTKIAATVGVNRRTVERWLKKWPGGLAHPQAVVSPLSETVEADTSPTVPDQNEASEVASGKEPGIRARVIALAKQGHNVTQIAREIGIARQNVYLHLPEELRPRAVKRNEADVAPLSETIGAHADPMVPELGPDEQEAAGSAATQS